MRPNHNNSGNRGSAAAPKPGDSRRMLNYEPINCRICGQVHPPRTVWITRYYTNQGWMNELAAEDCPNPPLPPAPDKFAGIKDAQEKSDAMFNVNFKPYGF